MNETHGDDRGRDLSRRFAERLAEHYRPEPFEPAERARFDARLRQRMARRPTRAWVPALVGAAAALALAWWIGPAATPLPRAEGGAVALAAGWEADLLWVDADATLAEEDYLPGEYEAIALAFLEGV